MGRILLKISPTWSKIKNIYYRLDLNEVYNNLKKTSMYKIFKFCFIIISKKDRKRKKQTQTSVYSKISFTNRIKKT